MRRRIGMIIIGMGEVLSLVVPALTVTVIVIMITVAPCALFAALTGFISVMAAVKCGTLVGALLACVVLTALIDHYRHCDSGCRAI